MTELFVRLHNLETDEIIDREMTAEELSELETKKAEALAIKEAESQAEAKKAAEKAVLLEKLGITEDEAKLLLS